MRFASTVVTLAAAFVASAYASCSTSDLKGPEGNAITAPYANETWEMGKEFTITWTPSTDGPVDLLLLYGSTSTNMTSIYTIVNGTANNGSYTWTIPSSSSGLKSTLTSGYGIQLIDTSSCEYQYSSNFGIKNPNAVVKTVTIAYASTTATATETVANTTAVTAAWTAAGTGTGTGTAKVTSPVVSPTKSMTIPASLKTTTTATSTSEASTSTSASESTSSASSGAALRSGAIGWNAVALVAAGMVGALIL